VKMAELNAALLASQNDNKALQTKLAASRSASSTVESMSTSAYGRTPGSAVKGRGAAPKTIMVGSVEAAKAAQVAQLKEELYSDFTGLIGIVPHHMMIWKSCIHHGSTAIATRI
jgi:hypothetical protein